MLLDSRTNRLWDGTIETVLLGEPTSEALTLLSPRAVILPSRKLLVQTSTNLIYYVDLLQNTTSEVNKTTADCLAVSTSSAVLRVCEDRLAVIRGTKFLQISTSLNSNTISNWPSNLTARWAFNNSDDLLVIGATDNSTMLYILQKESCSGSYRSCWYGWPLCSPNFYGWNCSLPVCLGSLILYDRNTFSTVELHCNGNGACQKGSCTCNSGYFGKACESWSKPNCEETALLDYPLATCECAHNITGGINC